MYFIPKDYTSKITYLYCWAHWNNCYYSKVLYWFYTVVVVGDNLGNSWNSNSNFGQRNQLSIEQMKRLLRGNNVAIDLKLLVTFWIKVKCYIIFMIVSSMLTVKTTSLLKPSIGWWWKILKLSITSSHPLQPCTFHLYQWILFEINDNLPLTLIT